MTVKKIVILLVCLLLALAPMTALARKTDFDSLNDALKPCGLDISPYKGKAIYLNFFTGWCGYCMEEMPDIKRVFDEYNQDELQIILIHVWDGEDASASDIVRETYGMQDMTFHEDQHCALAYGFGLEGYPTHVFINADGTISTAINYTLAYEEITAQIDAMGIDRKK